MAAKDKGTGVKSAYELALERLDAQGIERPREEALSDALKGEIAGLRKKAEARLAELEILHRDRIRKTADPDARSEQEEEYLRERRRIEEDRDRRIERSKGG
jgi:hypothetical protein